MAALNRRIKPVRIEKIKKTNKISSRFDMLTTAKQISRYFTPQKKRKKHSYYLFQAANHD